MLTSGKFILDGKYLEDDEGGLTIDNISTQDGGKYICTTSLNTSTESGKDTIHHFQIVSIPKYTISAQTMYSKRHHKCTFEDLQLAFQNFALGIDRVICGETRKVCEVFVKNVKCLGQVSRLNLNDILDNVNIIFILETKMFCCGQYNGNNKTVV